MSWFVQNALIYKIFSSWFQREIIMVFIATFNNISAISWRSVYWWKKLQYIEKTTDLSQVTDNIYNIFLIQVDISDKLNKKQI